ncbi:MAG: hypothetical protein ACOCP8_02815 [archaeon]
MEDYINYNEGKGTIYDRYVINQFLMQIIKKYNIKKILECFPKGIHGIPGITSFYLSKKNLSVFLKDNNKELKKYKKIWKYLGSDFKRVKLKEQTSTKKFELVWSFNSLNYFNNPKELFEHSSNLVLYIGLNRDSPINKLFRKEQISKIPPHENFNIIKQGYLDWPGWPDTNMKLEEIFEKIDLSYPSILRKESKNIFFFYKNFNEYKNLSKKLTIEKTIDKFSPEVIRKYLSHLQFFLFQKV